MKVLNDFKCPQGHTEERFIESSTDTIRCSVCGLNAVKVIAPIRSVMEPHSGDFHDATRKWAKHHEQMALKGEPS